MSRFTITSNRFLEKNIHGFYNTQFWGFGKPNNPDYLNILKNDNHHNWSIYQLKNAVSQLKSTLAEDLPKILNDLQKRTLTVCVIPRAKKENTYRENQLLFKSTVQTLVKQLNGFEDGSQYLVRHTTTKTTHLRRPIEGYENNGDSPYPGITKDTCSISNNIIGKDILLIDDIYTKTVNIDEDAIQALLRKGARSVTFYAIGNTVFKNL